MAEIWFWSDPHFGHENIIKFAGRPFVSAPEMDAVMILNHNKLVSPSDHIYCLGDWTMKRKNWKDLEDTAGVLNGHMRLILGNHDHLPAAAYLKYFEKVMAMQMLDRIRFTHIPIHPRSMGFGTVANVHGHIHDQEAFDPVLEVRDDGKINVMPYVNICVEKTNYAPIHFEEVRTRIRQAITKWGEKEPNANSNPRST